MSQKKSTFLKYQVYKSIWLFWTTLDCIGPFGKFEQLWTVGPFHTILFVSLARNCQMDLWTRNFREVLFFWDTLYCICSVYFSWHRWGFDLSVIEKNQISPRKDQNAKERWLSQIRVFLSVILATLIFAIIFSAYDAISKRHILSSIKF